MDKKITKLTVAAITLVGATYALKKINDKRKNKKVETTNNTFDINLLTNTHGYDNVLSSDESEQISDFSTLPNRKYVTLDYTNNNQTEETKGKTM